MSICATAPAPALTAASIAETRRLVQVARSAPFWSAGPSRDAREKLQREAVPRLHGLLAENDRLRAELAAAMIATEAPQEAVSVATRAETRARIAAALLAAPERSNRAHADALGVSHHTVADVRDDLTGIGQIAQLHDVTTSCFPGGQGTPSNPR